MKRVPPLLVLLALGLAAGPARGEPIVTCVPSPQGLALDGAGQVYVADRSTQAVVVWNLATVRSGTVASGLAGAGDVDLRQCTLFAAERHDFQTFPLGIAGVIRDFDGTPLAGATVLAISAERGNVSKAAVTTADGAFSLPLSVVNCRLQHSIFLGIQTAGDASRPPRAVHVPVTLTPGTGLRGSETLVDVTLEPVVTGP